ncbi:hypothetical protein GCM10027275_49340 [Rhabdobacter roseus]|uniref:Uncharacterized protein n=1 Tax=Rhabdobacter roseus TaxID=1655419 RepID=A0A840TVQ9_9BACT|nr:hypothetical protein [Rhabdobacter roseus]MBB5286995.1 hypothetical protein [Rhabdobacter roseus]
MKTLLLFGVATLILMLVVSQYFFCPRFEFEARSPFAGPVLYNPYQSIDSTNWVKCNFHAHAKAWRGVPNGKGNASDIHRAYGSLNYGIHCVSNYQQIDTTNSADAGFIPAYEHGYNPAKTHQLVLGGNRVLWLDYLFPQTTENKQNVLNRLQDSQPVIILNHPKIRDGYTEGDLQRLTGYDCM